MSRAQKPQATEDDTPTPRHRCEGCRYWHTGPPGLCHACQEALATDGYVYGASWVLPDMPESVPETSQAPSTSPATSNSDASGTVASFREHPEASESPSASPPIPSPRYVCSCCVHLQQAALDADLRNPCTRMKEIANLYGVSLYALRQHSHRCMNLPCLTPAQRGRKSHLRQRRFLSFADRVVREVETLTIALDAITAQCATLGSQRDMLVAQRHALQAYLRAWLPRSGKQGEGGNI